MNLFGCKFCVRQEDGSRFCERKNFDSLLWAIITVFQVNLFDENVCLFTMVKNGKDTFWPDWPNLSSCNFFTL